MYRGIDTRLGRAIAIKVLPSGLSRDADRLARLQREARIVAALSHPHIVTIRSVEAIDRRSSADVELADSRW